MVILHPETEAHMRMPNEKVRKLQKSYTRFVECG